MTRPVQVPINLGCCPPDRPRCRMCPPSQEVLPETVSALVASYRQRAGARGVRVRFFGGAPPHPSQVDAIGGLPFGVRVRPDLLSRDTARALQGRGLDEVEIDGWTFHDPALREINRPYRAAYLRSQSEGLARMGLAVGGVLAPGLPATDHARSLEDADAIVGRWSFVRIHPVLVIAGSDLARHHAQGRYTPMTLDQALTTSHALLDRLESAGVAVRRVGIQPGPDAAGKVLAGPVHPGFRELVESRRALARLDALLRRRAVPASLTIHCAPEDEARVRGPSNANLRALRADHRLSDLAVLPDPALRRGTYRLQPSTRSESA